MSHRDALTRIEFAIDALETLRVKAKVLDPDKYVRQLRTDIANLREALEQRGEVVAWMPHHWRETLTKNPHHIVGVTCKPDYAEDWDRVVIAPAPGAEPEEEREGWARDLGDDVVFEVDTSDGIPARGTRPCRLTLLPEPPPSAEPEEEGRG